VYSNFRKTNITLDGELNIPLEVFVDAHPSVIKKRLEKRED
jgi:hypothetical protein